MKLFLSHAGISEVAGGIEVYAQHLARVFPDTEIVDYHSYKQKIGDTAVSLLREPFRAERLGKFVQEYYPGVDTIFTNGMFCWNLKGKNQVNICHGTYAAFAEKAVSKKSLDYYRLRYIYSHFEKKAAQNARLVVSNSLQTQKNAKTFLEADSNVIYPPVDFNAFKPSSKEKAMEKLGWSGTNILFVGRPEKAKGFGLVQFLASQNLNMNFRCVLSRPEVSHLPNLFIHDSVPHNELADYYNASDLVLFPSHFEGFGLVAAEALACNKKVLMLRTGIACEFESRNLFVTLSEPRIIQEDFQLALESQPVDSRTIAEKKFSLVAFSRAWKSALEKPSSVEPNRI